MGHSTSAPVPSTPVGSAVSNRRGRLATAVGAFAVLVVLSPLGACSRQSSTEELRSDPADETVPGPAPTAPPVAAGAEGSSGADVDVNELIRRIDALNSETDVCTLLTGQAIRDVTRSNVNLTSLLTNPSGFTQLFAALDRLFSHLVQIGPPDLAPSLQTMQGLWKSMSSIDPRSPDAESRAGKLIGDPKVQAAQDSIGNYVKASCVPTG